MFSRSFFYILDAFSTQILFQTSYKRPKYDKQRYNKKIFVQLVVILKYQCTADSNSLWCYFLYAGKTHNRLFLEGFRGGLDFFDPKIALAHFGVKKSWPPREAPRNRRLHHRFREKETEWHCEKRKDNFPHIYQSYMRKSFQIYEEMRKYVVIVQYMRGR